MAEGPSIAMALRIKNPESAWPANWRAGATRAFTEALTDVLGRAVNIEHRKEIERDRARPRRQDKEELIRRIDEITDRFNSRPLLDNRSDDEILGYNEQGYFD